MVAKLVYKNHTRILDTEMVCLPEGANRLTFKSPICFDSVPHDFMVELTLLVLPMSDVPAVADNNTKLLKILKKRHKVLKVGKMSFIYKRRCAISSFFTVRFLQCVFLQCVFRFVVVSTIFSPVSQLD